MAEKLNLVYALRDDELVHISDVERGLKCGCRCPACDGTLVARKGMIKAHHFAHHNSENCAYGYETSLHMAAKDILLHAGKLELPESRILLSGHIREDIWTDGGEIEIDSVELEKKSGGVIPDVIVHSGDKVLFVEIYVTHAIDWEKLKKLRELKIPTMEIDLRDIDDSISKEELESIILHGGLHRRYWAYDPLAEEYLEKCQAMSRKIWVDRNRTVFCPVKQCKVFDCVCSECDDNYGLDEETFVLCGGKEPVKPVEPIESMEPAKPASNVERPHPEPEKSLWDLLIERAEQTEQKQMSEKDIKPQENDIRPHEFIPKKKPVKQINWKKQESDRTIQMAKDILTKARHICLPELSDVIINGTDFDDELTGILHTDKCDITLVFYFGKYDDDMKLPGACPILGIDLGISGSCVTVKKFEDILIHDVTIKHWLRYDKDLS